VQYNDGFRTGLIGTPEYIASRIVDYKEAGVDLILGVLPAFSGGGRVLRQAHLPLVREIEASRAEKPLDARCVTSRTA